MLKFHRLFDVSTSTDSHDHKIFTKTSLTRYINKNTVITLKNLSHLWYEQVQRHTCDIAIQNGPFLSNEYTFLYL